MLDSWSKTEPFFPFSVEYLLHQFDFELAPGMIWWWCWQAWVKLAKMCSLALARESLSLVPIRQPFTQLLSSAPKMLLQSFPLVPLCDTVCSVATFPCAPCLSLPLLTLTEDFLFISITLGYSIYLYTRRWQGESEHHSYRLLILNCSTTLCCDTCSWGEGERHDADNLLYFYTCSLLHAHTAQCHHRCNPLICPITANRIRCQPQAHFHHYRLLFIAYSCSSYFSLIIDKGGISVLLSFVASFAKAQSVQQPKHLLFWSKRQS